MNHHLDAKTEPNQPDWVCVGPEAITNATGTVVVIDVLRAFTTACVVWANQPASYELTASVETALARKAEGAIVIGEVNGAKVDGFDYGNSPAEPGLATTTGKVVVHRSSNGTTAVERAENAKRLFCASFNNATATYEAIKNDTDVTFCITGKGFRPGSAALDGDEDQACADFIMALRHGRIINPEAYTARIHTSNAGRDESTNPAHDRAIATQIDTYPHALIVTRTQSRIWLHPT
ncbi:2-phosphosulfolactate phosphatase [Stomatohabitans albus]|uniref:2-phosphosulfolactate phosphatase n=1 Tax=Stomatohabitans albus TaxID=3110766 RepID=UPI00300D5A49